ncbi:uncharacterized protein LOC119576982 isoform X1 [Penaeus monodon]|uniref:uncharacterized protein LOC119576982 isoform X1 n=1 Tax=Penaeus monodon TaxID=6687 RepID=UPI0018A7B9EF|nr:uncharacterized protein LOC119576982 isoform X1 [Penaeus monodon]
MRTALAFVTMVKSEEAFLLALLFSLSLLFTEGASDTCGGFVSSHMTAECSAPFSSVAGRCVLPVTAVAGSWVQMRRLCREISGDMVRLRDDNFVKELFIFLRDAELEVNRFWVQNSPFHGEYFLRDGALARMTFPGEDPAEVLAEGTKGEGCLLMHIVYHIFFRREPCEQAMHVICEKEGHAVE